MSGVDFGENGKVGVGLDGFLWGSLGILVVLSAMCGLVLAGSRVGADSTAASIVVTSSCQMTSTTNQEHYAEVTASTYQDNIGKTTFTATCNDVNGYDVYAIGYTNNEFGRNDMQGATTGRLIATGTATSGGTSAWAMKLTSVAGSAAPTITTGYTAYHAVPASYTKVVSYANSTMEDAQGSKFEATYAAYAANTQAPDAYTGKVKYTLVHPSDVESAPCAATYTLNYASNGGAGNMDSQTICSGKSVGILPNGFTAPAPVAETQFAVWNTAADGSGYTYLPGQSVANLADAGSSVTLYAQWAPKYIQDLTASKCETVTQVSPLTVYDRRDENSYTVRYLQGACWMTQNLRIVGSVRSQYSNFSTYDTVNVCEGDLTAGSSYDQARCHDSGTTSKGVWYNYAAASAKTVLTDNNSTTATQDICPSGWRLPSYDTNSPAGSINSMAGVYETVRNAFSPVIGGYYNYGSLYSDGSEGDWWSSGAYDSASRYHLIYYDYNNSLRINGYSDRYYRYYGHYIRCVRTSN